MQTLDRGSAGVAAPEEHKLPRVFRILTPSSAAQVVEPKPAAAPGASLDLASGAVLDYTVPKTSATTRRRRTTADKRPGPLLQVFQAPVQATPFIGEPRKTAEPEQGQTEAAARLIAQLAELDTIFDDIRRAQAFDLELEGDGDAWLQLDLRACAIAVQIQNDIGAPAPVGMTREQVFSKRPERTRRTR